MLNKLKIFNILKITSKLKFWYIIFSAYQRHSDSKILSSDKKINEKFETSILKIKMSMSRAKKE